jgi:dTMP kinase
MKGLFITLEGIDGSGKSTLAKGLNEALLEKGIETVLTRAPGGFELGMKIRELILHGHIASIKTELFLFLADRAEHVETVIKPALDAGKVVICDRFSDSTIAYQASRGLDSHYIESLCDYATGPIKPDLTLLIDIDPNVAFERLEKTRHKDRIENEGLYLLKKISEAYMELAYRHPRIKRVEGSLSKSELLSVCLDYVTKKLP